MIHVRTTVQIAPGRQADAVARAHEWVTLWKEATGTDVQVSVVTAGTLGRLCFSGDFESMGAWEADDAKGFGSPKGSALNAKQDQEERDRTCPYVPNTWHDEFWRDA